MNHSILKDHGPLAHLAGVWEGNKGDDIAPSDDRNTENNKFRERIVFEPFGPVDNHEQRLFGLRYLTQAWRLGEDSSFHEETGYWLWDSSTKEIMRCFLIPRGVSVIAGGKYQDGANEFELSAMLGSPTYGICSNPFLDREFQTVEYKLKVTLLGDGKFSYHEDTVLKIKGNPNLFHHTDQNTLTRV